MTFVELIGFIIALLALIILFFKQKWEENYKKTHPKEYAKMQRMRQLAMQQNGLSHIAGTPENNRKRDQSAFDLFDLEDDDEDENEEDDPEYENQQYQQQQALLKRKGQQKAALSAHHNRSLPSQKEVSKHKPLVQAEQMERGGHFLKETPAVQRKMPANRHLVHVSTYQTDRQTKNCLGRSELLALRSKKNLVILKEIFDKPLSLRNDYNVDPFIRDSQKVDS